MKATRITYRADKRSFQRGDMIKTAGEFHDKHPENGRVAEGLLEARRPVGKPTRRECLMVFETQDTARNHWAKMINGKLYEVEIEVARILHRADMRLVDQIGNSLSTPSIAEQLADSYWAGEMTGQPIVEILLPSATVSALISDSEAERKAHFRKLYRIPEPDSREHDEEMERILNEL